MKKIYILSAFILFFIFAFGGEITKDKAREVAKNLMFERTELKLSEIKFSDEFIKEENGKAIYYVFNVENNKGFVIVSAEDNGSPILGYSIKGNFNQNNLPIQLQGLLDNYSQQIDVIRTKNLQKDIKITNQWQKYSTADLNLKDRYMQKKAVSPLLKTSWNQDAGYNADCPVDASGPGGHAYAGCVATATAQVMKYHHHPYQGTGNYSYAEPADGTCSSYGTLSADFAATTYNFASMPDNSYNAEIATLIYHVGVAVGMDYCYDGSGSNTAIVDDILETYFGYNSASTYTSKGVTSDAVWVAAVKAELDAARPLVYRGDGTGGHAFVCDGYDASDNLHFNFGWSGSYDGYYTVSAINPGVYDFTNNQGAVFGITPLTTSVPVSDFNTQDMARSVAAGGSIQFYDQSSGGPTSWSWEFPGGTPSTSTSENPSVTYSNPGVYKVSLTATNASGAGNKETKTSYITVSGAPTAASCSPTTNDLGNYGTGVFRFVLSDIDNSSGSAKSDDATYGGSGYLDLSSNVTTTLETSTLYNVTVTVGATNAEYARIYIDYNNDGDFVDAGEQVYDWAALTTGQKTGSFTTPANPTLNTMLRCRVISDGWVIQGSCGRTVSPAGQYKYGQAEDYGVYIKGAATTTWDGSTDADWNTGSNWDNGVPGLYTNAIITTSGTAPIINNSATCNNLTINAGASLTINATKSLAVNGDLTLKSPASNGAIGSIIDNGSLAVNGTTTVERHLSGANDASVPNGAFSYISSPVSNATALVFTPLTAGSYNKLWKHTEGNTQYEQISNTADALNIMQGYVVRPWDNTTFEFTGDLNTGNQGSNDNLTRSVGKTKEGYNLVGNPYPSAIDYGTENTTVSGWDRANIENTIWYRSAGNFATYNSTGDGDGTNGGQKIIPAMQAFWVKVIDGQTLGTLKTTNEVRVHNSQAFYAEQNVIPNRLLLSITNGTITDEAIVKLNNDASDILDNYDSEKMFGDEPQIYSKTQDNDILAINALGDLDVSKTVNLGYKTDVQGSYTINLSGYNTFDNVDIILEDKQENNFVNLSEDNSYVFNASNEDNSDRLVLHLTPKSLSIDENQIVAYSNKKDIYINNLEDKNSQIYVYDILGNLVYSKQTGDKFLKISLNNSDSGYYLIKVVNKNNVQTKKLFIE